MRLDHERLAKQAFLRNLELGGLAAGRQEATAPWVGQVHSFLAAAHIACDMVHPCEVDVNAIVTALDCRHLESELGPKGTAVRERCRHFGQTMLHHRCGVFADGHQPASICKCGWPSCAPCHTGSGRRRAAGSGRPASSGNASDATAAPSTMPPTWSSTAPRSQRSACGDTHSCSLTAGGGSAHLSGATKSRSALQPSSLTASRHMQQQS